MSEESKVYTAITFAPVQGFIEKSRKLRDLYGSSFLLSYLARVLCEAARKQNCEVISPAIINVTQGTPNQIIIYGHFSEANARNTFNNSWQSITEACHQWIENKLPDLEFCWKREWQNWTHHAWEFFWATGRTISEAREALNDIKRPRSWIGVNWQGESSTLSGTDAIAWNGMQKYEDRLVPSELSDVNPEKSERKGISPKRRSYQQDKQEIERFYTQLSYELGATYIDKISEFDTLSPNVKVKVSTAIGQAIIDKREQLSIPELVKRLITVDAIAEQIHLTITHLRLDISHDFIQAALQSTEIETPEKPFREVNRFEEQCWTGWFQGDGDRMGKYLQKLSEQEEKQEREELERFSKALMEWGENQLKQYMNNSNLGRIVYAGGDDFMGVLFKGHSHLELSARECLDWFGKFPDIWKQHGYSQEISVSVGFVWAAPNVPQRDVLQHCREAEKSAKNQGRDRIALRVLFNSGNYLEWVCPWQFLNILDSYRDRSGNPNNQNWSHIYEDVAMLESRHAFTDQQVQIAQGLFDVYFPKCSEVLQAENRWNTDKKTGILGEQEKFKIDGNLDYKKVNKAVNDWVINLAKVGFHFCDSK